MTTIQRCQQRTMHTRDAVSEGAARKLVIANLPAETQMSCKCGNGECKPEDCDAVYAHDSSGVHLATFHGRGLGARKMADDSVCVYRMPGQAKTQDAGKLTLASLNEVHRKFYEGGTAS
jgi:hypothetical protein